MNAAALTDWLIQQARVGMGNRTRNCYLISALAFANWCALDTVRRLPSNPFSDIPKADERSDPRRQRRALTPDELRKLLDVANRRPLFDAATVRRGERRGQTIAELRPETVERLQRLGRERALIYKTLALTGLRKGELSSLTVGQAHLDERPAYLTLDAADEKNREGSDLAIRDDLAADLRGWLAERLTLAQQAARDEGRPVPMRLPDNAALFDVPAGLLRILNRDLKAAGIPKRDDRGRVVDVHAMRTTFGTLLSRGGVPLRTAQAAMRHSDPSLTANVYTDPRLLDVSGALDALPSLPLTPSTTEAVAMTGTDGRISNRLCSTVAPTVAPTQRNSVHSRTSAVKVAETTSVAELAKRIAVKSCPVKTKEPLTTHVNGSLRIGATRRLLNFLSLASGAGKLG